MASFLGNLIHPTFTGSKFNGNASAEKPDFGLTTPNLPKTPKNHLPPGLTSLSYVSPQIRFGKQPPSVNAFQQWVKASKDISSLKPFQEMAIEHLAKNRSVVVASPTSSGKTLVAEYAVWDALYNPNNKRPKRVFYTTPRKALSNEKFEDFVREYDPKGEGKIGLMTGDVTLNRDAPVMIMTTEVLRNMLYDKEANADTLKDLSYIVLDECQTLDDPYRGMVWEETIINAPQSAQMIHLSATIQNAKEYTGWLGKIQKIPTELVSMDKRPVPLVEYMSTGGKNPKLVRIFDEDGKQTREFKAAFKAGLKNSEGFDPVRTVAQEAQAGKLPGLFFQFSRRKCDDYAQQTAKYQGFKTHKENGIGTLTTPQERAEIQQVLAGFLAEYPWLKHSRLLEPLSQTPGDNMLTRGVAPHHGGLLPAERKAVEVLLKRGLLKAVFATDTLAAGMNVPARSVTISTYTRYINGTHEPINTSDYQQTTGRAGRLGMYDKGFAILSHPGKIFADPERGLDPKEGFIQFIRSAPNRVDSQIEMNPRFVLHLLNRLDKEKAQEVLARSFKAYQEKNGTDDLVRQFDGQCQFLQSKGYLDENWKPTYLGQLTRGIFNDYDLLLADAFYNETFKDIQPAELAGLMTIFIAQDNKNGNGTALNAIRNNDLREKALELRERGKGLNLPVDTMSADYYGVVHEWAAGGDWVEGILQHPNHEPGNTLDIIRRTANLLQQMADSPILPEDLRETAQEATDLLLRDEVLQQVSPMPVSSDERSLDPAA